MDHSACGHRDSRVEDRIVGCRGELIEHLHALLDGRVRGVDDAKRGLLAGDIGQRHTNIFGRRDTVFDLGHQPVRVQRLPRIGARGNLG